MSSFKSKLLNGFIWRLCFYSSSFVLNIFIANNLGAEKTGTLYYLLNNISFVVLLLSLGLESAVAYFTSRKEIPASQLLSLSVIWSMSVFGILSLILIAGVQFNLVASPELAPYLILNIASSILANCLASILFSSDNNKTPNLTFTLMNVVLILLLPAFPLANFIFPYAGYTKIYLLVTALPSLIFIIYLGLKNIRFTFGRPADPWLKNLLRFSLQSFIYSCLYVLLLRCDYWLVNYFCSPGDLGNYLQTTKLTQIILLLPTLVSFSLFPLIVSHIQEQKNVEDKLLKLMSIYFYAGLTICILLAAVGYWVFPWLYGNSFSKMYLSFILLCPGILGLAIAYPLATFYSGKNLIKIKIKALVFSIIIIVTLDILLIPWLGIYGAAISSTFAYCFYFFYLLICFRKIQHFRLQDLLNIRELIKENIPGIFVKKGLV